MKSQKRILLGFIIVLLPPLLSAWWTVQSGRTVRSRIEHLNTSLFPLLQITNNLTLMISEVKDSFVQTAIAPDEENYQNCRRQVIELDNEFKRLLELSPDDPEIQQLYRLTRDYCDKGLDLIRAIYNGDDSLLMEKGADISNIAGELLANIKQYHDRKNQEFSESLNAVAGNADRTSLITTFASSIALAFGMLLAYLLSRWFSQVNHKLAEANAVMGLRVNEISTANQQLEKEVSDRKRAEDALRRSLETEAAISQVSELFATAHSPNLREVAAIFGKVLGANMSFIGLLREDGMAVEKLVEWTDDAAGARIPDVMDLELRSIPIWLNTLSGNQKIEIANVDELPKEAHGERQFMRSLGLRSILLSPIASKEQPFWGYMGFAQVSEVHAWTNDELSMTQVGCEMLANYLARKKAEDKLKHDAFHDALTGLPNRTLVMDRLEQTLRRLARHADERSAVLFIDLDRFKPVNDSLGHHAGDQLLIQVGRRLSECVRQTDTVARLGGDEFITILEDLESSDGARVIAERILKRLNDPFYIDDQEVFISCSIGISVLDQSYKNAQDVLRDADIAMYRAKVEGKSRYVIFQSVMQQNMLTTFKLEADLRRALEREEFELNYQPIVSLTDACIVGFEALLRWRHGDQGMVSPAEFIPIAEKCGLMSEIGVWVMKTACHQAEKWRQLTGRENLSIAVNVSASQFYDRQLVTDIREVLETTTLPANLLKIELTESILIDNVEANVQMLKDLKALGIQILIDDFGTGYSSLSYLKRFPLDALKIDRSFIRDIPGNIDDEAITATVIAMAHTLNLDTIAEGVETDKQLQFLREEGCDQVQGYKFSKPLPTGDVEAFLHNLDVESMISGAVS